MTEKHDVRSPFWDHIRIEEIEAHDGQSEIRCEIFQNLLNSAGVVHGGALATLVDASIGSAVRSTLDLSTQTSATVDLNIKYIKAGRGTVLTAKASLAHRGRTLVVGNSEIYDDQQNLVAIGSATFMILKRKQ
ncbi:hypothetical protein BEP19_12105 [Ammoniphilus oxalaticus]|uniref:Thioesterase domain-containing protein n=1 Tax=Ammoniphilus oxalaticus TaxID=66863 RepID=A0A419SGQ2_9BACL|nr:PaaI family thioesterase [Ammoniphilus oxalaticus]RKD22967.1 hypothetical protein BEP19_12105 [Ammoniphilus oxalaticus]